MHQLNYLIRRMWNLTSRPGLRLLLVIQHIKSTTVIWCKNLETINSTKKNFCSVKTTCLVKHLIILVLTVFFFNTFSTRASKFLWMEERNSDPTQQLTNNRSSDSSTSDCTKQMANCCRGRGGSSNSSIDFGNKITLNHLSGENLYTSWKLLYGVWVINQIVCCCIKN